MNIIIYTLNSPIRLHALLTSIKMFFLVKTNICIYVQIENEFYKSGYEKVFKEFPEHKVVTTCDEALRFIESKPHIMSLCDSNIFTRPFSVDVVPVFNNPTVITYSCSLGLNLYNSTKNQMYNYKNYTNEFGDIWLDGNIHNSKDILYKDLIPDNRNKVMIDKHSCMINIYSHQRDRHLNEEFLKGKVIDLSPYLYIENKEIHILGDYTLIWRKE